MNIDNSFKGVAINRFTTNKNEEEIWCENYGVYHCLHLCISRSDYFFYKTEVNNK